MANRAMGAPDNNQMSHVPAEVTADTTGAILFILLMVGMMLLGGREEN